MPAVVNISFPHGLFNYINIKQIDFPRSGSDSAHEFLPYFNTPYISCGMLAMELSTSPWKQNPIGSIFILTHPP